MNRFDRSPAAILRDGSWFLSHRVAVLAGWIATGLLLIGSLAYGQAGADPAVANMSLQPAPIPGGVGAPLSISLAIGNAGTTAISGGNFANQMRFTLTLNQCAPTPDGLSALSGSVLTVFTMTYDPATQVYRGVQKANVVIKPSELLTLTINTKVTVASSNTANDDIGASCNIQPNSTSRPQPTDNDFASLYTHTVASAMPVSLVSFFAQLQPNRTVLVSWKTSWEKANKVFIVERSKDLINFEEVGAVNDVAGTVQQTSTYQLRDLNPYRGRSYYRLRQIDLDGTAHLYPAEVVTIDGIYGVYPNPIRADGFSVSLDEPLTAVLQLQNAAGQLIEFVRNPTSDTAVDVKPAGKLPTGMYILTVEERASRRTYRLIAP